MSLLFKRHMTRRNSKGSLKIGKYFQSLGANYLIAADRSNPRRIQEAGRLEPAAETAPQWESCAGQDRLRMV